MLRSISLVICCLSFAVLIAQRPAALKIDVIEGPTPWTSLDVEVPKDQFQFAIVTDRTGGLRPGVFAKAVDKINLMQPQFVMSVGDLITGYTEDRPQLLKEWKEFDGLVNRLQMPFFYLPGNHDITNKVMEDLWKERYGPTYYHFVYKDVLFLCLNSEDQRKGAGRGTISDQQYEYIKKTLADNSDVKWTLVFLHQPLWEQPNPARWPDVEQLLRQREHTVFAGHVHHYVRHSRNNGRYYTLATTGGGSGLRGPRLGEFDHISWVTMTDDGPIIANLALDAIYSDSVVTAHDYAFIQDIYRSQPVRFQSDGRKKRKAFITRMQLHNPVDRPATVYLKPGFSFDYRLDVPTDVITIPPNGVEELELAATPLNKKVSTGNVPLSLDWTYLYEGETLKLPLSYRLAVENEQRTLSPGSAVIDGQLDDWKKLPYTFKHGERGDLEVQWGVSYDDDYLYLAAKAIDDAVVVRSGETPWKEDYLSFVVNADPYTSSVMNTGNAWYRDSYILLAAPQKGKVEAADFYQERYEPKAKYVCQTTKDGYILEAAIPLSYVIERQGADWKHLRINVGAQDEDPNETDKPRVGWMPSWRGKENVVGSGMFWRD